MANRQFTQFAYGLEKAPVTLYFKATGAGNGANLVLDATNSKGIKSVTRNADGDYTITFSDKYQRVMSVDLAVLSIDGSTAPLANSYYVKSMTTGSVTIRTYLATISSLVAPGTNDQWIGSFTLSNSSAI